MEPKTEAEEDAVVPTVIYLARPLLITSVDSRIDSEGKVHTIDD